MKTQGYIQLIRSADHHAESVIEFTIIPGEKTPWHYHTLFSETFEVLSGNLEVGLDDQIRQLKKDDKITIAASHKHYFHNISKEECLIKVTISPGNTNFEHALLISKGLAKDGLASPSGTPKSLTDLALFVYLNNSKMVGLQRIAAPLFNFLAKKAIKKGRLKALELEYCQSS